MSKIKNKFNLTLTPLTMERSAPGFSPKPVYTPASTFSPSPNSTSTPYPSSSDSECASPRLFDSPRFDIDIITRTLNMLDLTNKARNRLDKFLTHKKCIGEVRPEDLETLGELGAGNGAVVKKVRHLPSKMIMACKKIQLELKPALQKQIVRELKVLHRCNFPHIIGFYQAFQTGTEISVCMEYMDGGSLDMLMKKGGRIPEPMLGKVTLAVLKGLTYLRDQHAIMHRDIKPCNILVNSSGDIKLCDFGVSRQLINSMANSFVGTRSYMSPERLEGSEYSVQSDIWSLGLSLVEMAIGLYPIPAPSPNHVDRLLTQSKPTYHEQSQSLSVFDMMECIIDDAPPRVEHESMSPEFTNFVDSCLKKDPKERGDLNVLLTHPWVEKYETEAVDIAGWVCDVLDLPPPTPN